ncbi:hypothetical protein Tco_0741624 [Tanacetum coccineum]
MAMNVIAWICYVCEGSALCICSSTSRPVGAYDLGVATPIALVYAGLMTSGDAKSWYMISGDVKSWVLVLMLFLHIFTCILFIVQMFEILALINGFSSTPTRVTNIIVDVFSTWMTFGGNTSDLGSFGEESDKITDLHQIHEEVLFSERGDGIAGIKRRRRDLSSDDVRDSATAS